MGGSEDSADFAQAVTGVRSIAAALDALKRARRISWNLYFHSLVRPPSIPPGLPGIPTLDDVRQALFDLIKLYRRELAERLV